MKDTQVERLGPVLAKVPGRAMISFLRSALKLGFTTEEKLQLVHVFLGELRKPSKRLWLGAGESYRFVSFRISPWQKQQHRQ